MTPEDCGPQEGLSNKIEAKGYDGGDDIDPGGKHLGKTILGLLNSNSRLGQLHQNIIQMRKVLRADGAGIVKCSSLNTQDQFDHPLKTISPSLDSRDILIHSIERDMHPSPKRGMELAGMEWKWCFVGGFVLYVRYGVISEEKKGAHWSFSGLDWLIWIVSWCFVGWNGMNWISRYGNDIKLPEWC
ncbi:hypothetical protein Nepgr_017308 [Nepenthes gracilis]|uniref:Uncharacterized protein n=1 Tax=Nepenthes gracilis TaxID=150966 RepID=A0AAD3SS59_NEPGR|nr:hypothetical protein Nepgr_017308 [Nepenthes gracilis]